MASFGKVLKSFGDISEKFTKAISYSQHNQSLLPSDRQLLKDDSSMTLCSKKLAYLQRKSIAQSVANWNLHFLFTDIILFKFSKKES